MSNGWHFTNGNQHYYVGASDVASAEKLLLGVRPTFAKTIAQPIPDTVARYLSLDEGKILTARFCEGAHTRPAE